MRLSGDVAQLGERLTCNQEVLSDHTRPSPPKHYKIKQMVNQFLVHVNKTL